MLHCGRRSTVDGGIVGSRRDEPPDTATTDADWLGFDHDVLAVAKGVVRDVRYDALEGRPLAPQSVPNDLTARTLYGNFVVLESAPGVLRITRTLKGQRYAEDRGPCIARCCTRAARQSGAAGAPHVHFHLSDWVAFEESEGLPDVIDAFSLAGKSAIERTFDPSVPVALVAPAQDQRRGEMPQDQGVVRFR